MTLLRATDFVSWNAKKREFDGGRGYFKTLSEAQAFIDRPVAPEITMLVSELTAYFGHVGMHEICKMCFAGQALPAIPGNDYYGKEGHHGSYTRGEKGVGCCKPCGLQGQTGCLSKPLGCAIWMCGYTSARFPQAFALTSAVRKILRHHDVYAPLFEGQRQKALDKHQRWGCLKAIAMLRKARGVKKNPKRLVA